MGIHLTVGAGVWSTCSKVSDGGIRGHCVGGEGTENESEVVAGDGMDGGDGG